MKIPQDKQDELVRQFNERGQKCVSCGNSRLVCHDSIYEIRVVNQPDYTSLETMCGGLGLGGYAYAPAILVSCDSCGYMMHFSTIHYKIFGHKEP